VTQVQPRRLLRAKHGYALVLSLVILLVLPVLGLTLLTLGPTEVASSATSTEYSKAFYAADGGLESGVVRLRALLATTPSPTSAQLAAITAPTLSTPGLSFNTYSVQQLNATPYRMQIATGPYTGMRGIATDYQITAQVVAAEGTR
jgi:Tfp pilus assembly protein PilX